MKQPVPRNSTTPLQVGDRVQIVPEWQDPGDYQIERRVTKTPADSTSVRIRTVLPDLAFQRGEWIEADKLVHIPTTNP